jgi:type III restriction enzyme
VDYWTKHEGRDPFEVKVEVIVAAANGAACAVIETQAAAAFGGLYDDYKKAIGKLSEARRSSYERLRLATAKPVSVPWLLPDSIGYRRKPSDRLWPKHLFVEDSGKFRADLKRWESDVLEAELARSDVVAWLRNIDRQQWSLEIPFESGGAIHPTFPDLLMVRQDKKEFHFDLLEPHDSSLGDNYEKAVGFAKFAESFGHLFGRIQMIRGRPGAGGKQEYVRLDFNRSSVRAKALLLNTNPQLDALFESDGKF